MSNDYKLFKQKYTFIIKPAAHINYIIHTTNWNINKSNSIIIYINIYILIGFAKFLLDLVKKMF